MPNAIKVTFGFETIDEAYIFLDSIKNAPNNTTSRDVPSAICERCGRDIFKISKTPEKTITYSKKYHNGIFCYNCQQILKTEKQQRKDKLEV